MFLSSQFDLHQLLYVQSAQEQMGDEETERAMEQYRQQLNGILSS